MPKSLSVPLTHVASHSTAHYLLQGLNEIGVEYLFCNFGTDHAPLIEELAKFEAEGLRAPKVVLCPHENVGIHMAEGEPPNKSLRLTPIPLAYQCTTNTPPCPDKHVLYHVTIRPIGPPTPLPTPSSL